MPDPFNRAHKPKVGEIVRLSDQVAVITAPNASPMTFTGTQTYLLGKENLAIVDPGPESVSHLEAIIKGVAGRRVSHILVTHSHVDHSPLSRRLSLKCDAPVLAFGKADKGRSKVMTRLALEANLGGTEGIDSEFSPDVELADGDLIDGGSWTVEAIHTPGHLSNHLCFAVQNTNEVFTGDHVMGWATTMVSPPDGDLTNFMSSMKKLASRSGDKIYFPGHGGAITKPLDMVNYQITHRKNREKQIIQALGATQSLTPLGLAQNIYTDVDPRLIPAAARNVLAHLIDLHERGFVVTDRPISPDAEFSQK